MPRVMMVLPVWCVLGSLLTASPAPSQTADVIFAGNALSDLRSAANPIAGLVQLQNVRLKRDLGAILNDPPPVPLAALIVPKEAGPANSLVRRVFNDGNTVPEDLTVDSNDITELRKFIKNGLVQFFLRQRLTTQPSAQALAELKKNLDALPPGNKEQARRFAGAVLLDRGIRSSEVAPFIQEFQSATQKQLETAVKTAEQQRQLDTGKPYAFGTRPITEPQLAAIPTDSVTDFLIDGVPYKKAWVGSSVVIVKPSETSVPMPKTGIEKLQLEPDLRQHLSKGNDLPPKPLGPIPGKK